MATRQVRCRELGTCAHGRLISDRLICQTFNKAIAATQHATDLAASKLNQGLDSLRGELPFALSRASASADALLAEGSERARETAQAIRSRAEPMQRQAEAYIRQKPMQSMLLAAGVGALITLMLTRSSGR